jgi:very-short-patch-repair endonuclease
VHVAIRSNDGRKRRDGIVVHRRPSLSARDIVVHKGVPVTSARRTLLDARRKVSAQRFDSLLRQAEKQGLNTGPFYEIENIDLNEFERRLFALCRRHSIPLPEKQQVIGPFTVDFLWPEARLIVETDGWEDHGTRAGFEADRARDAWLLTQGYRVARFTWRQLRDDPATVVATLRSLLKLP